MGLQAHLYHLVITEPVEVDLDTQRQQSASMTTRLGREQQRFRGLSPVSTSVGAHTRAAGTTTSTIIHVCQALHTRVSFGGVCRQAQSSHWGLCCRHAQFTMCVHGVTWLLTACIISASFWLLPARAAPPATATTLLCLSRQARVLLRLNRPVDVTERGLVFVQNFLSLLAAKEAAGLLKPWFKEVRGSKAALQHALLQQLCIMGL